MSSIYNTYLPGCGPYEKIPEETPPGSDSVTSSIFSSVSGGLSGLLGKLNLNKLDAGDLLLLLILFLLLKEGDGSDWVLLLALAAVFLLDGDG